MGSMKGKQAKIDAAFGRLADMIQSGHLLAGTDPVGFLDIVAAELKDRRAECEMLRSIINTLDGGAVCKERTLQEVIDDVVLSDWARWVAVEADGCVWEHSNKPIAINRMWKSSEGGKRTYIGRAAPPLDFRRCIWEIKK